MKKRLSRSFGELNVYIYYISVDCRVYGREKKKWKIADSEWENANIFVEDCVSSYFRVFVILVTN